ncbi:MAG: hypothetical protein PHR77_18375 [Kiritimatiellae bacterium]|nr:hypothetical protein [Kiritimatiellia bacterium]
MAQTNISAEIYALRTIFDENLSVIDKEYNDIARTWPDNYAKELDVLQKKMQKAGDLEGWQDVNRESKRFNTEKTLPASAITTISNDLQVLQKRYHVSSSGIDTEKSRKIVSLTEKYVSRLSSIQKSLTMAGKIDDAILVNAEIKKVKSLAKVSAAEFALMAMEAEKAQEQKVAATITADSTKTEELSGKTGAPDNMAGGNPANPKTADAHPSPEDAGPKIYDGQIPPVIQGINFKSVQLSGTERMRVVKKVTANAMIGKKSATSISLSGGTYFGAHERTGSSQNFIRLNVKASNVSYVLEGLKIAVQIFCKDTSGKGGGARELRTDVARLPKIEGGKQICVELPPVVTISSSSRYRGYDYGTASNIGQEFYGIVVSIFDDTGALAYQGASSDALEKMGIAEMPKEKPAQDIRERFEAARDAYHKARAAFNASPNNEILRDAYLAAGKEFTAVREAYQRTINIPPPLPQLNP